DPNLYVQDISHEPQWKYRQNGKDFGPMSFPDLISVVKKQMDVTGIQAWNDSQQEWNEIYLVEKVADELGVSRRVHPRVPIMGTLTCETPHGTIVVKAISISEGGLGVNEATTLKIGEKYKAVFASPNLYASINCTVEVMYVGAEGYAGLRFFNLPIEAKS